MEVGLGVVWTGTDAFEGSGVSIVWTFALFYALVSGVVGVFGRAIRNAVLRVCISISEVCAGVLAHSSIVIPEGAVGTFSHAHPPFDEFELIILQTVLHTGIGIVLTE